MKPIHYLLLVLGIWYVVMAAGFMRNAGQKLENASADPACATPIDLYIGGITWQKIVKSFTCMGEEGVKVYRGIETREDVLYPMSYGLFYSLIIYLLFGYIIKDSAHFTVILKSWRYVAAALPLMAMLCDFGENHVIVALIDDYAAQSRAGISDLKFYNTVKWVLAFMSLGLIVLLGIAALIKKLSARA